MISNGLIFWSLRRASICDHGLTATERSFTYNLYSADRAIIEKAYYLAESAHKAKFAQKATLCNTLRRSCYYFSGYGGNTFSSRCRSIT